MAFIVDGHLEKKVVQRLCSGSPVRMTNLNGRDVSIPAIVKAIESFINLFKDRYFPIVIIVDREGRAESSISIEQMILDQLQEKGHDPQKIVVACPDRMIENWIISGQNTYNGSLLTYPCSQSSAEGLNGKSVIRASLQSIPIQYGETTTGVEMFCTMRATLASQNSVSFSRFHSKISQYCYRWANT
jgi:hypothetical protein